MAPYLGFSKKIASSVKPKQFEMEKIDELEEFKDWKISISAFQETTRLIESGELEINPASMYDRVLSISNVGSHFDNPVVGKIVNDANQTLDLAGPKSNFEEMNSQILNYYTVLSDMKLVSETMSATCEQTNSSDLSELAESLENSINEILKKIDKIFGKKEPGDEGIFSSIFEYLKNAFNNLVKTLKENPVVDKLKEAFKKAAEFLDKAKLWMLASMFGFISKVAELAKKYGWTVKEINVEMPEIGVKLEKLKIGSISTPIPIPVPQINPPKVSIIFTP